jgi:phenylalanyl-tRNA synthetase alpha chain
MNPLQESLQNLEKSLVDALKLATDIQTLEAIRTQFLGKKGSIPALNDELQKLSLDQKRLFGPEVQKLRTWAEQVINEKRAELTNQLMKEELLQHRNFDVTASRYNPLQSSLHPLTLVTTELEAIFSSMGFAIVHDREVENEWHNFTALNIPENHPARDAHDTFWIDQMPGVLMRTHTSTVQIRTMKNQKPPLAMFSTGRVFRNEATDASHDFMFMQGEPLLIDKNISIANLLDCARTFLQTFFDDSKLNIRVRPSYFPFVEPGIEIDLSCPFCKDGCSTCKRSRWIELMGAGLVHPNVLKACDIDPSIYSGFAMGFGISRLAMLKFKINDVRLLQSNKIDILKQFFYI